MNSASLQPTTAAEATVALSLPGAYPPPNPKAVKRLLRHQLTRKYFKDGTWTDRAQEATVFADSLEAVLACARHGLIDVELALRVGSGTCDIFCTPIR